MQSPTLKQIAKIAGVHVSTVSRALKRDSVLPKSTIERIVAIANEYGYRPNPLTTALMEARRKGSPARFKASIGLLIYTEKSASAHARSWLSRLYAGAIEAGQNHGFSIETFCLRSEGSNKPEQLDRVLSARGVQGILLPPEHEAPLPFPLEWDKYSLLSLHTGRSTHSPRLNQILSNHFSSTNLACARCYERGYKRVGLVLRDHPNYHVDYGRLVLGAYYARSSLEPKKNQISPLKTAELDPDEIAAWVKAQKPDSIVFAGGGFSVSYDQKRLFKDLAARGIHIDEKVGAVVLCQLQNEGIAGIDERPELIGSTAIELLADQICRNQRGIPENALTHFIDGTWVEGGTLPKR